MCVFYATVWVWEETEWNGVFRCDSNVWLLAVAYTLVCVCVWVCMCREWVWCLSDVRRHQQPVHEEHVSNQPVRLLGSVSHGTCHQGRPLPREDHQSVFPQQQLQPGQELQTGPLWGRLDCQGMLFSTILYCSVYSTLLCSTLLFYFIVIYTNLHFSAMLYYTVLFCAMLYYTTLIILGAAVAQG